MNQICIRIPPLEEARSVELEVTVGSRRHFMNYRIESCDWSGLADESARIERLREFIRSYDERWELFSIGRPSGSLVPVTFRERKRGREGARSGNIPTGKT